MTRFEIPQMLDGTHPTASRAIALAHQALIFVSSLAIALETVPNLPDWAHRSLITFELFVLLIFVAEYITRLVCTRHPLRYALSFWGIVDLLSCLPLLGFISQELNALRSLRLLRLVRILKLLHSNRALKRLQKALHKTRGELTVFAVLASIILYIAGVGIYIFEHEAQPDAFSSIPISLWWAIVSFTTVGYGDIYPITPAGRAFTATLLFIGLGVIAVPTALISAALIQGDMAEQTEDNAQAVTKRRVRPKPERRKYIATRRK